VSLATIPTPEERAAALRIRRFWQHAGVALALVIVAALNLAFLGSLLITLAVLTGVAVNTVVQIKGPKSQPQVETDMVAYWQSRIDAELAKPNTNYDELEAFIEAKLREENPEPDPEPEVETPAPKPPEVIQQQALGRFLERAYPCDHPNAVTLYEEGIGPVARLCPDCGTSWPVARWNFADEKEDV